MNASRRWQRMAGDITIRQVWAHMLSRSWGKLVPPVIIVLAVLGPLFAVRILYAEMAAVALVTRPDSGGPILIPASCNKPRAELGKDYIVADGRVVRGRAIKRGCFYTVSAFKRLFPERFEIDNPKTFRVQQLTTNTRLLSPSIWHGVGVLVSSILAPLLILVVAMLKSGIELSRGGVARSDGA